MTLVNKILLSATGLIAITIAASLFWGAFNMHEDPIYSASFDADDRYFSITFRVDGGKLGSLVYDSVEDKYYSIQSKDPSVLEGVRSQKLSKSHKGSIYVTRFRAQRLRDVSPGHEAERELFLCHLAMESCTSVFSSRMNIGYPIEFEDGGLLFVGSQPHHHPYHGDQDRFLGYLPHDFYYRSGQGEVHRLTEGNFHHLVSVSLAKNSLIFTGTGGYDQIVRKLDGKNLFLQSDILRFPFDPITRRVNLKERNVLPFFFGGSRLDTKPSVSSSSKYIAYLGGVNVEGQRYYKVFVADLESQKVIFEAIPQEPQSFYGPVIIGPATVRYAEKYNGVIYFFEADVESKTNKLIASMELAAIASLKPDNVQLLYVEN